MLVICILYKLMWSYNLCNYLRIKYDQPDLLIIFRCTVEYLYNETGNKLLG